MKSMHQRYSSRWCGVVQCLNRTPKGMGFVAKNTASTKKAATLSIR